MSPSSTFGPYHVLLMAYVACLLGMTLISFFISAFYRKKFQQRSPRIPFVLAFLLGLVFLAGYGATHGGPSPLGRSVQFYALLGSGILSMYGSLSLYLTMRKVRK
jgi:hypothetical protein